MKKFLTSLALTTMLVCCLMMFACGGNADVTGTYKFESIKGEMGGVIVDAKVGDTIMGGMELTKDFMTLTIKDDNTATFVSQGDEQTGTWEQKDGKIIITIEEEAIEFTKDGNKLVVEEAGMKVTLSK